MIPDKIIYTDGHDVTVTDSTFKVKRAEYNITGITKYGLMILKPSRLPGVLLLLVGLVLLIGGMLNMFSPRMEMGDQYVNANTMALLVGAGLSLIGVLILGLVRERYAVRIATAEGEKNAIVSRHKAYISQIVDALNRALGTVHDHDQTVTRSTYVTE